MATTASPGSAAAGPTAPAPPAAPAPEPGIVGQTATAGDAASTVLAACNKTGLVPPQRFVLYTQIYTEAQRESIKPLLQQLDDMGLTTAGIENVMATAARVTIAEVEQLVEPGALDPDVVVTPGIFVSHVLRGGPYEKRIEKRIVR